MADRFRQKKEPRHLRLYHSITGSEAWLHLSGNAIKVLIALARYDDGKSNGELYFSERTGAKDTGLSRNTVRRALAELIEKGFIAQTKPGAFNRNNLLAATYRLTWAPWPGGKPAGPTREFEKWRPIPAARNSQAQSLTAIGSNIVPPSETGGDTGSDFNPPWLETPLVSVASQMSEIEPQILYQGDRCSEAETDQRKQANPLSGAILDDLRADLIDHLQAREPGEQSRLAASLNIPGGTLSKFIAGRGLPDRHAVALTRALAAQSS